MCEKCKIYIYDVLLTPVRQGEYATKTCKWKRIVPYIPELCQIVYILLRSLPPNQDFYQTLSVMDERNGHLGPTKWDTKEEIEMMKKKKCLRLFHYFYLMEPQLTAPLLSHLEILQESMMLGKCSTKHDYNLWFAQRFLLILKTYKDIHAQHDKQKEADLSLACHRIIDFGFAEKSKQIDWIFD